LCYPKLVIERDISCGEDNGSGEKWSGKDPNTITL
jgi:hypothetical protein